MKLKRDLEFSNSNAAPVFSWHWRTYSRSRYTDVNLFGESLIRIFFPLNLLTLYSALSTSVLNHSYIRPITRDFRVQDDVASLHIPKIVHDEVVLFDNVRQLIRFSNFSNQLKLIFSNANKNFNYYKN